MAIKNAFLAVFGPEDKVILNCWAHVSKKMIAAMSGLKPHVKTLREDIWLLQISPSVSSFEYIWRLLESKWTGIADDDCAKKELILEFFEKFKKRWLDKDPGWYEGFAPGVPSTDNALESLHLRQVNNE